METRMVPSNERVESLPLRQPNKINNLSRGFSGIQGDFSGGIKRATGRWRNVLSLLTSNSFTLLRLIQRSL